MMTIDWKFNSHIYIYIYIYIEIYVANFARSRWHEAFKLCDFARDSNVYAVYQDPLGSF